jgi:hypothetical protein
LSFRVSIDFISTPCLPLDKPSANHRFTVAAKTLPTVLFDTITVATCVMLDTTESIAFTVLLATQFFHSMEELTTGFDKAFPVIKLSFRTFLALGIIFFSV